MLTELTGCRRSPPFYPRNTSAAAQTINKQAILSATASLIAKLALSPTSPIPTLVHDTCRSYNLSSLLHFDASFFNTITNNNIDTCTLLALLSRGLCLLLMIGVNAIMISSFVDGMNESGSVAGTSLSTAANFSVSYVSTSWYFGAILIGVGMWLLSSVALVES
ncbi:hypothetical protein ACHAWO_005441 [Cyclotella atomus]|uniref:Uncharacterized protein n=1 Tax=Cyclotella atomus TaxID=382360 RepID=A0ABD3Q4M1_9STRA